VRTDYHRNPDEFGPNQRHKKEKEAINSLQINPVGFEGVKMNIMMPADDTLSGIPNGKKSQSERPVDPLIGANIRITEWGVQVEIGSDDSYVPFIRL
jgi:hypothetical protein